jgi:copper resistance protein D
VIDDPLVWVRALHFAATLLASGTVGFLVLVAEPAGAKSPNEFASLFRPLTILVWAALAVAILSGAAWLVLLASAIVGESLLDVCLHGSAWSVLYDTRFGLVWCARLAIAVLLAALMLRPATRSLQLAAAAVLIALPAVVGHAGATPGLAGNVHAASDMLHLIAAAAWFGGLPAFAWSLRKARRVGKPVWSGFAVQVTRRFSLVGILGVAGILMSGVVNSWFLLSGPGDLVSTDYGRLVAFKIALLAAMVCIAAVNRFDLTPRLPQIAALRNLQRNSIAEIGLGLCILLIVGLLGTLPPAAHKHAAPEGIPPDAAFVHIHSRVAMADVIIDPGHAGTAQVRIRVWREDLSAFPAKAVSLSLKPPTPQGQAIERNAVEQSDTDWLVNDITLTEPGIWTVLVTVVPPTGAPIPLDAPIVVERK